ncbi:hypothetical protein ACSBR1_020400 [Camellia fascicularis]
MKTARRRSPLDFPLGVDGSAGCTNPQITLSLSCSLSLSLSLSLSHTLRLYYIYSIIYFVVYFIYFTRVFCFCFCFLIISSGVLLYYCWCVGLDVVDDSQHRLQALFGVDDNSSPQLEELTNMIQDLSNRAYNLWISWVSDELSSILSRDLRQDDGLSTTSPLRGWEDTVVKQEQSDESQSEMKISLPAIPSLYITSFLFHACEEIHRVGGHVLDKPILQKFALRLLEKVGSRFGESTLKLGSMLTDGQVGRFKDKSAAAMSTFGDILPVQAAGLLSSFTASRSDSRLPAH